MSHEKDTQDQYFANLDRLQREHATDNTRDTLPHVPQPHVSQPKVPQPPIADVVAKRVKGVRVRRRLRQSSLYVSLRSNAVHAYICNLEGIAYTAAVLSDLILTLEFQRVRREHARRSRMGR